MGTAHLQLNDGDAGFLKPAKEGWRIPHAHPSWMELQSRDGCGSVPKPCPSILSILQSARHTEFCWAWGHFFVINLQPERWSQTRGDNEKFLVSQERAQSRASVGKQLSTGAPETRNLVYITNNPLIETLEYFLHYKSKYFSGLISPFPRWNISQPSWLINRNQNIFLRWITDPTRGFQVVIYLSYLTER